MFTNGKKSPTELRDWIRAEFDRASAEAGRAGERVRALAGRRDQLKSERARSSKNLVEPIALAREQAKEAEREFGVVATKARSLAQLLQLSDELAAVRERVSRHAAAVAKQSPELLELARALTD